MANSAIVLNVVDYGLGTVLCAYVSDDDFGASRSQSPCYGCANVARAAGDQRNFIGQCGGEHGIPPETKPRIQP